MRVKARMVHILCIALKYRLLLIVQAQMVSLFLMNNRVLAEAKEAEHKLEVVWPYNGYPAM